MPLFSARNVQDLHVNHAVGMSILFYDLGCDAGPFFLSLTEDLQFSDHAGLLFELEPHFLLDSGEFCV